MDDDILLMTPERLREEVFKLRNAIRGHRDQRGHDLCWWMPEMWSLLPEGFSDKRPEVPPWPEFIEGCVKFRQSLEK